MTPKPNWKKKNKQTNLCHPLKTFSSALTQSGTSLCCCSVASDSLQPHGMQHDKFPCLSPTLRAYSNSCPLSQWCHSTVSSSVIPFSSNLQYFPASGSFQMNQLFTSGGQSIGVSSSASVLPVNIQDWFPLRLTGWLVSFRVDLLEV